MSYTIWLIPDEEKVKSYLSDTISGLSCKYKGPEFEPHITLLGDLQLTLEEVIRGCEELVAETKPFQVETCSVEYSTTYYQCIFVRIKPTPELMNIYDRAKSVFCLSAPSIFMPHSSLFYGDISYKERQKIMESLEFKPQHFSVSSIVITPGGEHKPSEWQHLAEFKFKIK